VFVVDTNVLVYAADRDAPEYRQCRDLLLAWRRQPGPWYVTWPIFYEFLRVVTHPRVFRRPWTPKEAWGFVRSVLAARSLQVLAETERHGAVLGELVRDVPELRGNLLHDAHTVALMREHGIHVIYTRDTDFHQFTGLEVRDPLRHESRQEGRQERRQERA